MKNKFDTQKYLEVSISNSDGKVGEIRLKPNAILWKASGKHKKWNKISLERFIEIAESEGTVVQN